MPAQAALPRKRGNGIRRFELQRDLLPLANLIEFTFQEELDQISNPIVREMKQLAHAGLLLWVLGAFNSLIPSLMSGYVWMHNGQLAGNVSFSLESGQRRVWSISNVAVHPDFRQRGIATQLMQAALQEIRHKGAQWVVLEVRSDNVPAQQLYQRLGFQVYDTVDEMKLSVRSWKKMDSPSTLRQRRSADWQKLYNLCRAAIPAKVQEVKPLSPAQYRWGVERQVLSWFDFLAYGRRSSDWLLEEEGEIVAWLQATGHYMRDMHSLRVTVHPRRRGAIEQQLLAAGLYYLSCFPARAVLSTISTSHPEAREAWHQAGFYTMRLLDKMALDLRKEKIGGEG